MKMRTCKRCKESKPLTDEFFVKRSNRASGFNSPCKECKKIVARSYRQTPTFQTMERERSRARYVKNPLGHIIRTGINRCLRNQSAGPRQAKSWTYVGLSLSEFKTYISSLFQDGMSWENYGKWHIDHKRPLASFDFTGPDKEKQLRLAWNYMNLQPLWAADNIRKSDSFLP